MSEILIKSRITPPGLARDVVHRKRLTELLKENISKSLLLICTSAGFGKTTLVNDFLNYYGLKHAWYYTTSDINSFYAFFTYVVHSLQLHYNGFGNNTLKLLTAVQKDAAISKNVKNNINDCVGTFTNEFGDHISDDMILVIDDLHNIDEMKNGEWLNYFIDVLFDNLPPNLHVIITSREVPDFNISKLKAKRRLFLLTGDDLVFDNDETAQLLEKVYYIRATSKQISKLQSSIHGWVTGLHLVLQAYGEDFKELTTKHKEDFNEIFNYFARDIFDNLDKKTKEFLLNTAILENFDAEICDYLLETNDGAKIIEGLVHKNIFIESAGSLPGEKGTKRYNYQELFRMFLNEKLEKTKSKDEINNKLKRLFSYFLNKNDIIQAVNVGLKSGDYEVTVALIIQNYEVLFDKCYYDILWSWVFLIPDEFLKSRPHLLYLKGQLYLFFRSDPEKSLKYLDEALVLASHEQDIPLIVNCNITKTAVLLLLGNIEHVKENLRQLLNMNIAPVQRAELLYQISRVLYREGSKTYNEMIELITEALEICNKENIQPLKTDLFSMLGNVYSDWGDIVKAVYYFEKALSIDSDVYKRFRAMVNIITKYSVIGNYVKAKEYLDKTTGFCNSYPSLYFRRYLLRNSAYLSFDICDYEETIKKIEELNALETKNNIKHFIGYQYIIIGEAYYYLKKYDTSLKFYEISLNYIEDEYHLVLNSYSKTKCLLKIDPDPKTETVFLNTLKFCEENAMLDSLIQIEFNLADYYLRMGSKDTALRYLKKCLDVYAEKQYLSFLEQEVFNSFPLFDFAISNNIHKQLIKTIFENVRGKLQYDWLSEDCKKRLAVEIEMLTDLKLISFGKTEIYLRGELIEEDKWVRKKSKIILAYLLTKPDMLLNKDKIVDMFLQDVPLENADTIFHNTISNIRSAAKVEYPGYGGDGKPKKTDKIQFIPQFIIYENKNLSLNNDYYYDADCRQFERLFDKANSASSKPYERIEASIKAIELYKGEFMPGYYDPWCEEMRQSYLNMYQKLCENLIVLYHESGEHQNIIKYAEKLLEVDKLHPDAYLRIIESHVKLNNINAARTKFASMLKNYDDELGEKPEKQVLDRISSILGNF